MTPFEFVCAFYSVVLGVAVTQLMTSVGRLVEVRDRVRTFWVQSLWVVSVLLTDVENWWSMWVLRDAKSWSIYSFLLLMGLIAAIYLMTVLLFPHVQETAEGTIDLEAHYFKNRRVFFLATAAVWALGLACNWSLVPIAAADWITIPSSVVLLSIVGAITSNRRYHKAFAVLALLATLLMVVVEGAQIS